MRNQEESALGEPVTSVSAQFVRAALIAAVAISFLTIALAGLYALPNGDDFCRASLHPLIAAVKGWQPASSPFTYVADSWRFWTGRWAAMWLEAAVLHSFDVIRAYPAVLLAVWLAILAGLWFAVREALPRCNPLLGTLILFTLFWANMPGPGESLFWFTGAVENILPVALGAAAVALLASGRPWISALLSIIVPGLHELFGALLLAVLAVGALMAAIENRRRGFPWLICAALTLASELVVFTAPGNAVRAAYFASPTATHAVKVTAWQLLTYVPDWSFSGSLLAATVAIFAARPDAPWAQHFAGWRLAIVPAVTLVMVVTAIAVSTYVLAAPIASRTLAGICLVFLLGWLVTAIAAAQRLQWSNPSLAGLCGLVLAGSLVLQGNTRAGVFDLKDTVRPWHAAMEARYALLGAGGGMVLVPPAPTAPSIFFWRDILEDPTNFRNVCVASYFKVGGVAVRHR